MVHLNRIYTRSGDQGETSLGNGDRVPKTAARIIAYGGTDELNSILGIAIQTDLPQSVKATLQNIQNDLFDLGADLCVPEEEMTGEDLQEEDSPNEHPPLKVVENQSTTLENEIDQLNNQLDPLSSFVLPGGTDSAASLHHARTVCRRVEISVLQLAETEKINPQIVIYLNRLSDYLFVAARYCNNQGKSDILWVPGQNRS
jgi:cob(I)alamin adenosyltransferase